MNVPQVMLTSLAHGGGCGCKLAPSVLQQLLGGQAAARSFSQLLVGVETGDDAAVWRLDDDNCIIATTDFFMPIVDDPHDFGRIAATNAISDVYAMGGQPIMALAILGIPLDKLPLDTVRAILAGGASVCEAAGIPVAGGHSIDTPEPIYGLAVIGTCRKQKNELRVSALRSRCRNSVGLNAVGTSGGILWNFQLRARSLALGLAARTNGVGRWMVGIRL